MRSFIYLSAIRGLSALADVYADRIIPVLLQTFSKPQLSDLAKMKLGEALVMVAKRTGEMLPKYGSTVCIS